MAWKKTFKSYQAILLAAVLATGVGIRAQQRNIVQHPTKSPRPRQTLSGNRLGALRAPLAYLHDHKILPFTSASDPKAFTQTLLEEIQENPERIDEFVDNYAQLKKITGQDNITIVRDECYRTGLSLLGKQGKNSAQVDFIIGILNATHDDIPEIRFAPLKDLSVLDLFVLSQEEKAYPSTYRGIFNEIERQATANGETLLQQIDMLVGGYPASVQPVLVAAAGHGKLDSFLTGASSQQILGILKAIDDSEYRAWSSLQDKDPYTQFAVVERLAVINEIGISVARTGSAEAKKSFVEGVMQLNNLHASLRSEVMLGSFLTQYGRLDPVTLAANPEAKKLADANPVSIEEYMSHDDLFNQKGKIGKIHVSGVYFYSDANEQINDGDFYYHEYKKSLTAPWKMVAETEKVLVMERSNPQNGLKIMRVIGKPVEGSQQAVKDYMDTHGLEENAHLVRGHIFHFKPKDKPIDLSIGQKSTLLLVGGCGAYMYTGEIMESNPGAHLILNDSTGVANDNTALMKAADDIILSGKNLTYKDLMTTATQQYGAELDGYMTPDENRMILIGAMLNRFKAAENRERLGLSNQEELSPAPPQSFTASTQQHAAL